MILWTVSASLITRASEVLTGYLDMQHIITSSPIILELVNICHDNDEVSGDMVIDPLTLGSQLACDATCADSMVDFTARETENWKNS